MRAEIQKILEMQASGKISQEQAAELLSALIEPLAEKTDAKDTHNPQDLSPEFSTEKLGEFIEHLVQGALKGKIGTMAGKFGAAKIKISDDGAEGNRVNASKFTMPEGEDFEFTDNDINLSEISELKMSEGSEFSDNRLQASTLAHVGLRASMMTDTTLNGSSWDGVTLDDTEFSDLKFQGCKLLKSEFASTQLNDAQLHGCHLRNANFKSCEISDLQFHGCQWTRAEWRNCVLSDMQIHGGQFQDATWADVELSDGQIRGCDFTNCELRNIEVSDFKWQDVDFSNQKIDGNKALSEFLAKKSPPR